MRDRDGFIAVFKGERFFLHQRQTAGATKVVNVYREGDLLPKSKISVRWLQYCGTLPDKLKRHLLAYETNQPSLLISLLTTFLEIPEPELEIGRRIVGIHPNAIEFVYVVWFDGKTAVEFSEESFRERPTVVNIDLNLLHVAEGLKMWEVAANVEYYVLSSLATPVTGAAKALGKGLVRKATLITYKKIASKSLRHLVFRTLRDIGKAFSGAITKSAFKSGGEFYSEFQRQLTRLQIVAKAETLDEKGAGNPPTDAEIAVIAQKAGVEAYEKFILTLIKETLVKKALKKNDLTFKAPKKKKIPYSEEFTRLMVQTIYEQFSVQIAYGSATLLGDPAVAAYKKARTTDGFNAYVFQQEFVAELEKALSKFLLERGKAIGDAAVQSLATQAITML